MNILAYCLCLMMVVISAYESVIFFKATTCRQKAWLMGTVLQTQAMLHSPRPQAQAYNLDCKLYVTRKSTITWQRLPSSKKHVFYLPLSGKL